LSVNVSDADSSVSSAPTRATADRTAPFAPSDAMARSSCPRTWRSHRSPCASAAGVANTDAKARATVTRTFI